MIFIKNHKKLIALVAIFMFMCLVNVGSMPLRAETATAKDQQPGAIEKIGTSDATAAKKSPILPIIIGVVVVGAVAAVLILVVFKTKYDITGTWAMLFTGPSSGSSTATFTGTRNSGDVQFTDWWDGAGTYAVDGKKVTITHSLFILTYTGEFIDENTMSGTATLDFGGINTWNWTATRNATAASKKNQPTASPGVIRIMGK